MNAPSVLSNACWDFRKVRYLWVVFSSACNETASLIRSLDTGNVQMVFSHIGEERPRGERAEERASEGAERARGQATSAGSGEREAERARLSKASFRSGHVAMRTGSISWPKCLAQCTVMFGSTYTYRDVWLNVPWCLAQKNKITKGISVLGSMALQAVATLRQNFKHIKKKQRFATKTLVFLNVFCFWESHLRKTKHINKNQSFATKTLVFLNIF